VTRAGCGGLCPAFDRGCFGCFGPMDGGNLAALRAQLVANGTDEATIDRLLSTFTVHAFTEAAS
jgi:sulfhydrogenase subunit delta